LAFVVDGAEWCFDGWSEDAIIKAIEDTLDRIWIARDRQESVWIGDDLQTRRVLGDFDLWSLCSTIAPITLPAELVQELSAWLGSARRYLDDECEWPDGLTETTHIQIIPDTTAENVDVAWAHHHVRAGRPMACLGLTRSGLHETISSAGRAQVHWVRDDATHRAFWRSAIDIEGDSEGTLKRIAPHAFPDLHFHHELWRGLKRLAGGYLAVRSQIRQYLTVLDDYGRWVFTFPPPALSPDEAIEAEANARPTNQVIEKRFRGLDLDMAPEKPNVYANRECRAAREITVKDRLLYCEWHGKLEPHQNRLHVHAPVKESNNKVIIAIFDEHLPLP